MVLMSILSLASWKRRLEGPSKLHDSQTAIAN